MYEYIKIEFHISWYNNINNSMIYNIIKFTTEFPLKQKIYQLTQHPHLKQYKHDIMWATGLTGMGTMYGATLYVDRDKMDDVSKTMLGVIALSYFGKSVHHTIPLIKKILRK